MTSPNAIRYSLHQLRAFCTVAECLNFTVSAARLHVTQPTLSATIRGLEEQVGSRLFDRDTRSVRLTPTGHQFLLLASRMLQEAERLDIDFRSFIEGRHGFVRVAAHPAVYRHVLLPALCEFRAEFPDVRLDLIDVSAQEAIELLRRRRVDLALISLVAEEPDQKHTVVGEQTLKALLRSDHPLASKAQVSWGELFASSPIIGLNSGGMMGAYTESVLLEHGIAFERAYRVDQLVTATALVLAGLGIAIVSHYSAKLVVGEDIIDRSLIDPIIARPLVIARLDGHDLAPAAKSFHDLVIRKCAFVEVS